jgi:hypothetical protein
LLSLNLSIVRELNWVADHLEQSEGLHIITAQNWLFDEADIHYLTDACPTGIAFWSPQLSEGFQFKIPANTKHPIFYFEALAVLSAINHAHMSVRPLPHRIAVFTDNANSAAMFNTLSALPAIQPYSDHCCRQPHIVWDAAARLSFATRV